MDFILPKHLLIWWMKRCEDKNCFMIKWTKYPDFCSFDYFRSRCSGSVGKASDWRSEGPWFKPRFQHWAWVFGSCPSCRKTFGSGLVVQQVLGNSLSTYSWTRYRNPKSSEHLLKAAFNFLLLVNSKVWQFPLWEQQSFFDFFLAFILTLSQLLHLSVTIKTRHFL